MLDEEAVGVHVVQVHDEDLLEQCGRALKVVALDDQEARVGDRRQVADRLPGRFEPVEPLPAGVSALLEVELVDDQPLLIACRSSARPRASDRASCRRA